MKIEGVLKKNWMLVLLVLGVLIFVSNPASIFGGNVRIFLSDDNLQSGETLQLTGIAELPCGTPSRQSQYPVVGGFWIDDKVAATCQPAYNVDTCPSKYECTATVSTIGLTSGEHSATFQTGMGDFSILTEVRSYQETYQNCAGQPIVIVGIHGTPNII